MQEYIPVAIILIVFVGIIWHLFIEPYHFFQDVEAWESDMWRKLPTPLNNNDFLTYTEVMSYTGISEPEEVVGFINEFLCQHKLRLRVRSEYLHDESGRTRDVSLQNVHKFEYQVVMPTLDIPQPELDDVVRRAG